MFRMMGGLPDSWLIKSEKMTFVIFVSMCDIDPQWSVAYNTSAVFMSLNQMLPKFPYLRSCHGVCTSKSHIRNDLAGVTCSFKEKTTRWMFQEPEYPEIFQSDKILIIYRSVVSTLDHYSSSILKPFNSQASNVRPRGDDSPNSPPIPTNHVLMFVVNSL